MFKQRTYRFISMLMAFLLFFSTSGLTMDMHFCSGKLKRINVFGKAMTCAEVAECMKKCGKEAKTCHSKSSSCSTDNDHSHKGCCDNKSATLDMDYDFGTLNSVTQDPNPIEICSRLNLESNPSSVNKTIVKYQYYKPPLLIKDISVLVQSFLL